MQDQKKLLGKLSAKNTLLYTPLLKWYLDHGLLVAAVYHTIDYTPKQIFLWFVNNVTENRTRGDADVGKALRADVFKLLGNSAHSKMKEALEL